MFIHCMDLCDGILCAWDRVVGKVGQRPPWRSVFRGAEACVHTGTGPRVRAAAKTGATAVGRKGRE